MLNVPHFFLFSTEFKIAANMAETTNSISSLSSSEPNSHRLPNWFHSLKQYVQETDVSFLNLSDMKLEIFEISSILEFLVDSQIVDLDLSSNNLKNGMKYLSELLIKNKIQRLNVSNCHLVLDDVLNLMKVLNDSQLIGLNISNNKFNLYADTGRSAFSFTSDLVKSHLAALNLRKCASFNHDEEALNFIQELRNTSLTHLNLSSVFTNRQRQNPNTLFSLFSNLKHTSITHLNLSGNCVGSCDFQNLGDSLRDSNLIELDLSWNGLCDANVDALFEVLVGTKMTSLKLAYNRIEGNNNLNSFLTKTQIASLDLGGNVINCSKMFFFPSFLKDTSVVSLKLDHCQLTNEIGVKLIKSLEFSKLAELDVSHNYLAYDTVVNFVQVVGQTSLTRLNFSYNPLDIRDNRLGNHELGFFGELLLGAKIKHIDVSGSFWCERFAVVAFLEKLKKSSITSLRMSRLSPLVLGKELAVEKIPSYLINTQVTHFDFSYNAIGPNSVQSFVTNFKFTVVTHLNLMECNLQDEGAEALAAILKEMRIIDLNLSCNKITSRGATALAFSLPGANILSLKLSQNEIQNDGLEVLAQHAESTLITVLEVNDNPGNPFRLETIIWKNRKTVQKLVSFFERIAPRTADNLLQFPEAINNSDIDTFLEQCLNFYKFIKENSSAAPVLANEESSVFSKDQVNTILFDEFPKQFSMFVASQIEADASEHAHLLKKTEALGLSEIVELLLLNRPVYTIDKSCSILHPYVYSLLNKYKHPICNLNVEPEGVKKIIDYFTTFSNIEGARDVKKMLESLKPA